MAQLMLIKTANTEEKLVGDIVEVFEDDHKFSQYEIDSFTIRQIPDFTRGDMITLLPSIDYEHAYRWSGFRNRWSFDLVETMHVWRELPNGRWKELPKKQKFVWNVGHIVSEQWDAFENRIGTISQRATLIQAIPLKNTLYPENMVEVGDLN